MLLFYIFMVIQIWKSDMQKKKKPNKPNYQVGGQTGITTCFREIQITSI